MAGRSSKTKDARVRVALLEFPLVYSLIAGKPAANAPKRGKSYLGAPNGSRQPAADHGQNDDYHEGTEVEHAEGRQDAAYGPQYWLCKLKKQVVAAEARRVGAGDVVRRERRGVRVRQVSPLGPFLGRRQASVRVGGCAVMLGGTLVGGVLGELIGLRWTLAVGAGGTFVAAFWLLLSQVRNVVDLPDQAAIS